MDIDSYQTPEAESLLIAARERHCDGGQARRVLITEAVCAAGFLAGAGSLAILSSWTRSLSLTAVAVTVLAYLVAARVRFPVGSAWTAPTQLVFVPMLFMLPMPLVPLIVAGCSVIDLWPDLLHRRVSPARVLARVGDSFYSLGPALVLVLAGKQDFSWRGWPLLLLAFGAQLVGDSAAGLARTWFAERIRPAAQIQMVWLYVTDAYLSCPGLVIAASAVQRRGLVLLALPLIGMLSLFAQERKARMDRTLALSSAYRGAAQLLGDVIDAADHYTGLHTRQVVDLSLAVTSELGLDATRRRDVEFAALLHDVGKIRVPREIINKPGKLDAAEWEIMRQHTIEGEAMLKQVGGTLATVGRYVRASHERYDGHGYPDGLTGEAIPLESRIVCACDSYNAMTTDRPYSAARPVSDALAELHRCSGNQFDPTVVDALDHVLTGHRASAATRLREPTKFALPRAERGRA
jgi:HD-GYP domain-containing protein (c-di-GMP phosphodiesterase class II)